MRSNPYFPPAIFINNKPWEFGYDKEFGYNKKSPKRCVSAPPVPVARSSWESDQFLEYEQLKDDKKSAAELQRIEDLRSAFLLQFNELKLNGLGRVTAPPIGQDPKNLKTISSGLTDKQRRKAKRPEAKHPNSTPIASDQQKPRVEAFPVKSMLKSTGSSSNSEPPSTHAFILPKNDQNNPSYDDLLKDAHTYAPSQYLSKDPEYIKAARAFLQEKDIAYTEEKTGLHHTCFTMNEGWFNFEKFSQQRDRLRRDIGAKRIRAKVTDIQPAQNEPNNTDTLVDTVIVGGGIAGARAMQDIYNNAKGQTTVVISDDSQEMTKRYGARRHGGPHHLDSPPTADHCHQTLYDSPQKKTHQPQGALERLITMLQRVLAKRNEDPSHPNGEIFQLTLKDQGNKTQIIYARRVVNATGCAFGAEELTKLKNMRAAFQIMATIIIGSINGVTPAIWMAKEKGDTLCLMPKTDGSGVICTSQKFSYQGIRDTYTDPKQLPAKIRDEIIKKGLEQVERLAPESPWKSELKSALEKGEAEVDVATQFKMSTDRFPDLPIELRTLTSFMLLVSLNTVDCTLSALQIFMPNIIYQIVIPIILLTTFIPRRPENQQPNHRGAIAFAKDDKAQELLIPPTKIQTRTDIALAKTRKASEFPPVSLSQFTALTVIPNEIIINSVIHLLLLVYHVSTTNDHMINPMSNNTLGLLFSGLLTWFKISHPPSSECLIRLPPTGESKSPIFVIEASGCVPKYNPFLLLPTRNDQILESALSQTSEICKQ